jgi:hypothetical protein
MGHGTECPRCGGAGWNTIQNDFGGLDDVQCDCTLSRDMDPGELCPACEGDGTEIDTTSENHRAPCSVCNGER